MAMDFEQRKAETLASLAAPWPDKSPKGSVDAPIGPLLDVINLHPSFFTTSSCSGRISILRQPSESPNPNSNGVKNNHKKSKKKAGGGGWVFVSHEPVDPEAVVDLLFGRSPSAPMAAEMEGSDVGALVFRFEPLIVAVECKDAAAAQELVGTAIACGFRESGITSMQKRIMVAIRCSIRLEVPLGQVDLIMVSTEYVRYLIGVANEKMEANRKRTDGFLHVLQDKILSGSAKKVIHSARKAQACVTGESSILDFEAKQGVMLSEKLQLERVKLQFDNKDTNIVFSAYSGGDKEMSGTHKLPLSVVTLTIFDEPIEKLFLWGHSANPLTKKRIKEIVVFGGFGGVGHHARRNHILLLDMQSGLLKQIDAVGCPSARVGHTATVLEDLLYVIGGRGGPTQIFDDVWALNTSEYRWTLLECTGHTFQRRHRHATASVGSNIYVFGGLHNEIIYSCMNVLNTESLEWSNVSIHGEWPCARHSHSMIAYGPFLLMFGGFDGQKALADLYSFDTRTSLWKREEITGRVPSPRFSHSMFIYKNFLGIIGGCPLMQHKEELALLNLYDYRWIIVSINTVGRHFWIRSSTCVIGNELIIVGGGASCYAFGTKFDYPMKISLHFLESMIDIFPSGKNKQAAYSYSTEGHKSSQPIGSRLQSSSPVSGSYFEADISANKHGYGSDAKHIALQIKKKYAKLVKDILKKFGWLDLTKKVHLSPDGLHICLPISGEFYDLYQKGSLSFDDKIIDLCEETLEGFSVNEVSISVALDIFSLFHASLVIDDVTYDKKIPSTPQKVMREMVCSLLREKQMPLEMVEQLPVRWERLGDIIVLPVTSFRDPRWNLIAEDLWPIVAKSLGALRLARQGRILPSGTRDSTLEILVGDDGWVAHQENGILYSFDATKCMFSSGNLSEKLRMACLDCRDEVIVDLFAGIGYFVLPFLVKAKARLVYACEWNLHAIKALQCNIYANSVADQCIILEGDNRVKAPRGVADRVCLGLLPSSECSWRTAVRALRPQGGVLHIHGSVKDTEEKSWLMYIIESIGGVAESEGLTWDVSVQHVERVKSYGPHIRHMVADIRCHEASFKF